MFVYIKLQINQAIILNSLSLWVMASRWSCVMFLLGLPYTITSILDLRWKYSKS